LSGTHGAPRVVGSGYRYAQRLLERLEGLTGC